MVARPFESTNSQYFVQLFRTDAYRQQINDASRGIVPDRNRLYWLDFKQLPSPVPPKDEQAAIVHTLTWATSTVERAIRAKRQNIALINEQKQAIIHRAVTRGIDASVALRPSGIPWLGNIPQHWECAIKLKYISSLKGRLGWQGLKANEYSSSGRPVVSSAHFRNQKIEWSRCHV